MIFSEFGLSMISTLTLTICIFYSGVISFTNITASRVNVLVFIVFIYCLSLNVIIVNIGFFAVIYEDQVNTILVLRLANFCTVLSAQLSIAYIFYFTRAAVLYAD